MNFFLAWVGALLLPTSEQGLLDAVAGQFLSYFILTNLVLGLFNLIPLLPLDGGHVAIATYERIRSRGGRRYQVDVMKLLPLTYAVVMVLILLGVSTIFLDIVHPIHLN